MLKRLSDIAFGRAIQFSSNKDKFVVYLAGRGPTSASLAELQSLMVSPILLLK